jgi:pyruvate ferredoxin oxidoreductase alpha subunit
VSIRAPRLLTGGEAVAHALCQIQPDVVPVYPITPQTPIIQTFSSLVANGAAHTEIVNVESEHSAMSAAIGAALAGARTATATSSQGLALMAEVVYIAASMRAPLTMAVGNRALSGPINIHCDHSDSMLVRDSGVVQLFAENAQEAYDLMVMAPRIAEHPAVSLPVLVCQDGFTITHAAEPVTMLGDDDVRAFVGEYDTPVRPLLDARHPATHGPFAMPDYYFEFRRAQAAALEAAVDVVGAVAHDFAQLTGRENDVVEPYRLDEAESVIVALGSTAGTVKDVVDELREQGEPAGLLKLRAFRPFPADSVRCLLDGTANVIVLDRADSPGGAPPLAADVAFALAGATTMRSHVYGLGGRDLHPEAIREIFRGKAPRYVGVRGEPCLV